MRYFPSKWNCYAKRANFFQKRNCTINGFSLDEISNKHTMFQRHVKVLSYSCCILSPLFCLLNQRFPTCFFTLHRLIFCNILLHNFFINFFCWHVISSEPSNPLLLQFPPPNERLFFLS